jgi:hypothetical protein
MQSRVEEGKNIPREVFLDLQRNYSGNQIEKKEKGGACSIYGENERCIKDIGVGIWWKETNWKKQE